MCRQGGALILRKHGIVTAAATLEEEAVMLALKLEDACKMQLMAEVCGGPRR